MSLVVVGLEGPDTPLDLLERVAIADERLPKVLARLRDLSNLSEVVVLSTCLRTELYAVVERFHEGVADLQDFLAETAGTSTDVLADHVNVLFDDDVTVHLLEVAAGMRSTALGETEVLGQVRRAYERAENERACGPVLQALFLHAVKAGRRVRSATEISRGSVSLSHVAVDLAELNLGRPLSGARVVVVGAGETAEGVVEALTKRKVGSILIANRTLDRAGSLATTAGGRALSLQELPNVLADTDALFVSTSASEHVLNADHFAGARAKREKEQGVPLVVVDLGMPRNVDPAAREVPGVILLDMADLNSRSEEVLASRQGELADAHRIVIDEVERYRTNERARGAAPVVSAMRERFEHVVTRELGRQHKRLADLDERQMEQVESVLRDVLAKLAHEPTVALKAAAGTPRGERLVEALRTLFDL